MRSKRHNRQQPVARAVTASVVSHYAEQQGVKIHLHGEKAHTDGHALRLPSVAQFNAWENLRIEQALLTLKK